MVNAGRILIVPKGVWSSLTSYDMLDLVTQDGVAYIARQANVGVQPKTDSQYTYWQPFGNAAEPDNETIVYNANNRYTVNIDGKALVYDSNDGITVAIDGETIKFDEDEGYLYAEVTSNLSELGDVNLTTPVNGQVLTYNALTGKWVNANPTGGMQAHLVITSEAGSVVTVTTPSGSVITATQVSGSTTQWECDTQEYGVHTIDAVLAGDDARITVTVDTCKVYNIDDSHLHASITVTFPRGFTCRCQGQGENYYSNSNPYTFSVHHLGEYTITATDGADTTYTETVTISSSAQSVSMFCPSVANAPTDDVQMWLMFGGILDKNYTTLSEVLADSTTLATLIADNNAVDYMVRSKSWASNKGLVPVMTSDNTPSGKCIASGVYSSTFPIWYAFDDSISTYWASAQGTTVGAWVGYTFTSAVCVKKILITTSANDTYKVQGSNDGFVSDIHDLGTMTTVANQMSTGIIDNYDNYTSYRILCTATTQQAQYNLGVYTLQFYAYAGVGITEDSTAMSLIGLNNYASNTLLADGNPSLVPVMTSNTTPSGEVLFDSTKTSGGTAASEYYKLFDGNTATSVGVSTSTSSQYFGYDFGSVTKVCRVDIYGNYTSGTMSISVEGSNDNSTWNEIHSFTYTSSASWQTFIFSNDTSYRYWRINCTKGTANSVAFVEIQFYEKPETIVWLEEICNSVYIESVLNLKNPVMTSDNAPSGYVASADSNLGSGVLPYKAFDGVTNNYWQSQSSNVEHWLQLKFPQAVNIICFKALIGRATQTLVLKGSNDGTTMTSIKDFGAQALDLSMRTYIFGENDDNFEYYRLCAVASPAEQNYQIFHVAEMVFYGRQDV